MACASDVKPAQMTSARNDRGSLGEMPSEPLSLLLCGSQEAVCCRNDEHDPAGFDVLEHFREPEVLGHQNHD